MKRKQAPYRPSFVPPAPPVGKWVVASKNVWTCYTGFTNFRISVVYGHIHFPKTFCWTCYQIGQDAVPLPEAKSEEEAKAAAIKAVCAWLLEATVALDRTRKKLEEQAMRFKYVLDGKEIKYEHPWITGAEVRAKLGSERAGYNIRVKSAEQPEAELHDWDMLHVSNGLEFYSFPQAHA